MRAILALALGLYATAGDEPAGPTPEHIRDAAARSIALIRRSVEEYPQHRDCFSCHNQAVPALALSLAKARGFDVGDTTLQDVADHTAADLESALDDYKKGKGQPGGVERAGYALFTLELAGQPRGEVSDAVIEYLLAAEKDRDHWRTRANRPPSEASDFTATYLAVRALGTFSRPEQEARIGERLERVRNWLDSAKSHDNEDRVFRLLALKAAAVPDAAVRAAVDDLVSRQNDDGGWSQLDGKPSDAYATGSALVALHLTGEVPVTHPAYRRGLAALLESQLDDGSWHVVSRSKPFQTYFESGFPHGKDQFISVAGSSWATAALVLALPRPE